MYLNTIQGAFEYCMWFAKGFHVFPEIKPGDNVVLLKLGGIWGFSIYFWQRVCIDPLIWQDTA